jgi:hypothetical protein
MSLEDQLGEPVEVRLPSPRAQGARLGLALVIAGLVAGAIALVIAFVVGGFAQTEAGLCRLTWAPCSELSVASVEALSGVDLPAGTEVLTGYAQESPSGLTFRAEVIIPPDTPSPLGSRYSPINEKPDSISVSGLADPTYWTASVPGSDTASVAVQGVGVDGRTVIRFDTGKR